MRHSYIDRPRRLPAPRAVLLRRTRFAPVALALPLVTLMWLTIGLPIFAELSSAGGGNGRARDVVFGSGIAGGGSGGGSGGRGVAETVAATTVSPRIVREFRLIRERVLISASAGSGSSKTSGGNGDGSGAVKIAAPVHLSPFNPNTAPLSAPATAPQPPPPPTPVRPPPPPPPPPPLPPPPPPTLSPPPPPPPPPLDRLRLLRLHPRRPRCPLLRTCRPTTVVPRSERRSATTRSPSPSPAL